MPRKKKTTGRPTVINAATVRKLEEAFKLDATITEACLYAGISRQTYYEHYREKQGFSDKIQRARMYPVMLAKSTVLKAIEEGDAKMALRWLEKRDSEHYGVNAQPRDEEMPKPPLSKRTLEAIRKFQTPPKECKK